MNNTEIDRIIRRIGAKEIDNSTQLGTFVIVDAEKFKTKGIANRDNARWKRAQYIIIDYCPSYNIKDCLNGFLQFSEFCQYLIISNVSKVYKGNGQPINLSELVTTE